MRETAKPLLLKLFKVIGHPLAIHEIKQAYLDNFGTYLPYSENCLATRMSEMAKDGILESQFRKNENYKEWFIRQEAKEIPAVNQIGLGLQY